MLKEEIVNFLNDCDCVVRGLLVVSKEIEERNM